MIRSVCAASILWLSAVAFSQSPQPTKPFEVASIRPHEGPMRTLGIYTSGARLTTEASNLLGLVMFAYNLKNYQVSGSVPLLTVGDQRFAIVAKAEGDGPRTKDEFRQMMQLLLADRFKLTGHREMREIPVYALVVGKNAPSSRQAPLTRTPWATVVLRAATVWTRSRKPPWTTSCVRLAIAVWTAP